VDDEIKWIKKNFASFCSKVKVHEKRPLNLESWGVEKKKSEKQQWH
jgi:hypothetical protein